MRVYSGFYSIFLFFFMGSLSPVMSPSTFMKAWNILEEENEDKTFKNFEGLGQILPQGGFLLFESGWLDWAFDNREKEFKGTAFKDILSLFFTKEHSAVILPSQYNPVAKFNAYQIGMLIGLLLCNERQTLSQKLLPQFPKNLNNKLSHYEKKRFFEIFFRAHEEALNGTLPFSPFILFYVLTAFFILKFDSEKDLFDYFEGIQQLFPLPGRINVSQKILPHSSPPLEKSEQDLMHSPMLDHAYTFFSDFIQSVCRNSDLPPYLPTRPLTFSSEPPIEFSDCGEATVRMIANLIVWNFKSKKIDLSLVENSIPEPFKNFFLDPKFSSPETMRSEQSAKEWASLVVNTPNIKTITEDYEIECCEENFVKILSFIFGISKKIKTFKEFGQAISTKERPLLFKAAIPEPGKQTFTMHIKNSSEKTYVFTLVINPFAHAEFFYPTKNYSGTIITLPFTFEGLLEQTRAFPSPLKKSIEAYIDGQSRLFFTTQEKGDAALLDKAITYELPLFTTLLLSNTKIETNFATPFTPLHNAISREKYEIVSSLLKHQKTDPNVPAECEKDHFMTPLIFAIKLNLLEMVKLLLQYEKTDPNKPDNKRNTPLYYAIEEKNPLIIEALLSHKNIDPYALNGNGKNSFDSAQEEDNLPIKEMFKNLLNQKRNLDNE